MKEFKVVLSNRNFIYLWVSQIFSQITINILNFVLLIRIYTETHSTIAVSLFWVAFAFAAVLVGPFAAAAVDIFERRKVMMIANLIEAGMILVYALISQMKFYILYLIVFSYSFLNQFYVPAEQASLIALTPKKSLPQANSLFFLTQQAALAIGFGLGSVLLESLGFSNTLGLCAVFLFAAFLTNTFLPKMPVGISLPDGFEESVKTFFTGIAEGYNFIKGRREILFPFFILMGMQFALAVGAINSPALAQDILGINVTSAGKNIVIPGALGTGLGGILISKFLKRGIRKKKVIETSFLALSIATAFLVLVIPLIQGIFKHIAATLDFFVIGLSFVGVLIPALTYLQEMTPEDLRGRVFGNYWILVTILTVIPVIFTAAISEFLGVRALFLIMSGILFVAFLFSKKWGDSIQ